jgi:hypothetical protein
MKEVIQILERCAIGTCVSRPFKVLADDGNLYWLKGCGNGWNRNELCFELLAAKMGVALELPMADFAILNVPHSLLEYSAVPGIDDLKAGPAFGSKHVHNTVSLPPVAIQHVPTVLRQKILLFDWWIQNEDRILGELGGNVNLLWNAQGRQVTVIDHNNAFDPTFDEENFFQDHVFRAEREAIQAPFLAEQQQAFALLLARMSDFTADFPSEWMERHGSPGDFVQEAVLEILRRFASLELVFRGKPL